jgi:hypothetical protein
MNKKFITAFCIVMACSVVHGAEMKTALAVGHAQAAQSLLASPPPAAAAASIVASALQQKSSCSMQLAACWKALWCVTVVPGVNYPEKVQCCCGYAPSTDTTADNGYAEKVTDAHCCGLNVACLNKPERVVRDTRHDVCCHPCSWTTTAQDLEGRPLEVACCCGYTPSIETIGINGLTERATDAYCCGWKSLCLNNTKRYARDTSNDVCCHPLSCTVMVPSHNKHPIQVACCCGYIPSIETPYGDPDKQMTNAYCCDVKLP